MSHLNPTVHLCVKIHRKMIFQKAIKKVHADSGMNHNTPKNLCEKKIIEVSLPASEGAMAILIALQKLSQELAVPTSLLLSHMQ